MNATERNFPSKHPVATQAHGRGSGLRVRNGAAGTGEHHDLASERDHEARTGTRLVATVKDQDGGVLEGVSVDWSSSDSSVATVSGDGMSGVVPASIGMLETLEILFLPQNSGLTGPYPTRTRQPREAQAPEPDGKQPDR